MVSGSAALWLTVKAPSSLGTLPTGWIARFPTAIRLPCALKTRTSEPSAYELQMPAVPVSSGAQTQAPPERLAICPSGQASAASVSSSAAQTQVPPGPIFAIWPTAQPRPPKASASRPHSHAVPAAFRRAIWPAGQERSPRVSWSVAVVTTSTPSTFKVSVPAPEFRKSKLSALADGRSSESCRSHVSVAPFASPSRTRSAPADSLRATTPAPLGEWLMPRRPKALPEVSGFSPRIAATPVAVGASNPCASPPRTRLATPRRRPLGASASEAVGGSPESARVCRQRSSTASAAESSSGPGAPATLKRSGSAQLSEPSGAPVPRARTVQP